MIYYRQVKTTSTKETDMEDLTCNGYTNYSTWLLALYSDQERDIYNLKQDMFTSFSDIDNDIITPKRALQFARESRLVVRLNNNESCFIFYNVDWTDIAHAWSTELEEYTRYHVKA